MAAFGSGIMGADPLAEARAREMERKRAQTLANIKAAGQGEGKLQGGLNAVGSVAGEHLGAAAARMFGMAPVESPEIVAAKQQAALLEQINGIEGDTASSDWAKKAGRAALEMGDQRTAYAFAQEAGNRAKAEAVSAAKAKEAEQAGFDEMYGRLPTGAKLSGLASGDPRIYARLGITDPVQIEQMAADAQANIDSDLIKKKHAANKIKQGIDTSISSQDVKATGQLLIGSGYKFENDGTSDEDVAIREGIQALVAAKAAELMADSRQAGGEPLSQNSANDAALEYLKGTGQIVVEVAGDKAQYEFWKQPKGTQTLSLGNTPVANTATTPAQAQATGTPRTIQY